MNCIEIQEKIIDLISGDISDDEKQLIQEHIETCPICAEDFSFISQCVQCWEPAERERYTETYWEEFEISVHEKICQCRPIRPFPYKIVIPLAVTVLGAAGIFYILFFRPNPKEIVRPTPLQAADPYEEVYELTPEEQEEFIKIINQRYPGE